MAHLIEPRRPSHGQRQRIGLLTAAALLAMAALSGTKDASATLVEYYVGRDGLATFATGAYAGLPNPNAGRLTLLVAHGSHFHGIGAWTYQGAQPSQTVRDTSGNNRIPEARYNQPPLPMLQGSGLYSGVLASTAIPGLDYSNLAMRSMNSLGGFPPGSPEQVLFASSSGRWSGSIAGTLVGLELVSRTPGLGIGDETTMDLFGGQDRVAIGDGGTLAFLPVFWVASGAAPGTYSAEMRLVSLDQSLNPIDPETSGRFYFDFQPTQIPLPAGVWLMGSALLLIGGKAFRRARAAS